MHMPFLWIVAIAAGLVALLSSYVLWNDARMFINRRRLNRDHRDRVARHMAGRG